MHKPFMLWNFIHRGTFAFSGSGVQPSYFHLGADSDSTSDISAIRCLINCRLNDWVDILFYRFIESTFLLVKSESHNRVREIVTVIIATYSAAIEVP